MTPERIDIASFDLANEKLNDVKHMYIELGGNYFLYSAKYYGEEPVSEDKEDHSAGWKEKKSDFIIKVKKENIASIELYYLNNRDYWNIEIEVNGYPSAIRLYFKTKKELLPVFNKIDEYVFGTNKVS
jgi:hypothetical protein